MSRSKKHTALLQVKIEPHLKASFETLCDQKGMNMSTAIRLYILSCLNDSKELIGGAR